jgi:hypothetical protein
MVSRKQVEIERLASYICRLLKVRGEDSIGHPQLAVLLGSTAADDFDAAIAHAVDKQWLEVLVGIRLTALGKVANAKRRKRR